MDANPELFDRHRRRVLRDRAAASYADYAFLKDAMVDDIAARLADTRKSFARVLDRWSQLAEPYRSAAHAAIQRVAAKPDLSGNVREIVTRALATH